MHILYYSYYNGNIWTSPMSTTVFRTVWLSGACGPEEAVPWPGTRLPRTSVVWAWAVFLQRFPHQLAWPAAVDALRREENLITALFLSTLSVNWLLFVDPWTGHSTHMSCFLVVFFFSSAMLALLAVLAPNQTTTTDHIFVDATPALHFFFFRCWSCWLWS